MLGIEAIHVVMNLRTLGVRNRLFDRLHLLRNLEAGLPRLNHLDGGTKMAISASFKPSDESGMCCLRIELHH